MAATASASEGKTAKAMEWSEQHDVFMLREMLISDIFTHKKGSVGRGDAWDGITEKLNKINTPQFRIKDKRGVRERWVLLRRKFKAKIREEQLASGIEVDDMSEKEVLIEELIEKEESFAAIKEATSSQQKKDRETAEDIRKKAMERMGQTKKRKLSGDSREDAEPRKSTGKKRCTQPLIDFLTEKASADRELRQAELDIRKQEQEHQQNMMKSMLEQQQQQQKMNTAFLSVVNKLLEK